jgi:hypothetical protein
MIFLTSPGVKSLHEGFVFVFEPDGIAVDDNEDEDDDDGGNNIDLEEVACDMMGSDLLILRIARRRGKGWCAFSDRSEVARRGSRCRASELASLSSFFLLWMASIGWELGVVSGGLMPMGTLMLMMVATLIIYQIPTTS